MAQSAATHATDAVALTNEARALLSGWSGQGEILDLAAEKLLKAVQANPNYAKAYIELCRLHIMAGYRYSNVFEPLSLNTAERAILKAVELAPRDADAYILMGHLYINMNRISDATRALKTAEEIGTDNPWLDLNWADVLEKMGQDERALQKVRAVIASGTKDHNALVSAHETLVRYYVETEQWDEAEKAYQKAVGLEPESAWLRGNYAAWLANRGQFERAIAHARDALKLMEYGAARHTLTISLLGAWATLTKNGQDPARARAYFDEAYAMRPDLRAIANGAAQDPVKKVIFDMLWKSGYLTNPPPVHQN
jgi:Tfp pilus assembly protein PilF